MTVDTTAQIDHATLEAALRAADPGVALVQPWLLQTLISKYLDLTGPVWYVPDDRLLVIRRHRLNLLLKQEDLGLPDLPARESTLILLGRPSSEEFATIPPGRILRRYWRLLFRGRVEATIRDVLRARQSDAADVPARGDVATDAGISLSLPTRGARVALDQRIARIGAIVFNEARAVLIRERVITATAADAIVYAKFAAVFLAVDAFAPKLLEVMFPSINDVDAVRSALAADVPVDALLQQTRLAGADDADPEAEETDEEVIRPPRRSRRIRIFRGRRERQANEQRRRKMLAKRENVIRKAERAESVGNLVRGAVLRSKAYRDADDEELRRVHPRSVRNLDQLVERLAVVIELDGAQAAEWRHALRPLLPLAASGWWSPEGRLLYDLQKVCTDHEREVYSNNLVEWVMELGRRPLRRPLPAQRKVLVCRHLQGAINRLVHARITEAQRERLEPLLDDALEHAEERLRTAFRPAVREALDKAGLVPANAVENVAREKLVEELLDIAAHEGYVNFAHLRDAISRNHIRCEDLRSPMDVIGKDQLLRIDRQLGDALDGVYRRGEVYRYGFQKLSSLLYGWPIGRFLTKTVVFPLAGAYILLAGFEHTIAAIAEKLGAPHLPYTHILPMALMALFLLLTINWPKFRGQVAKSGRLIGRGLAFVFAELPGRMMRNRAVRAIVRSPITRLIWRIGVKPLTCVVIVGLLLLLAPAVPVWVRTGILVVVYLAAVVLLNSPGGRNAEQEVLHAVRVGWLRFTGEILGGVVRSIIRFFEHLIEFFDQMLYAVDEWFRFRSGQQASTGVIIAKTVFGVIWFYIAWLIRFSINLLVEPQINPIKHFPVVTVSHKLLIPLSLTPAPTTVTSPLARPLVDWFGMATPTANTVAFSIVWGIPGIFGFLAWELKENWKLYRANRPRVLKPAHFGSHGESLAQFLRPGIHSGTLPKLYRKLRKAHRRALWRYATAAETETQPAVHKQVEGIEHAEHNVHDFLQREFVALVNQHPVFAAHPVELTALHLAATHIAMQFDCPLVGEEPLKLSLEHRSGWIVAGIDQRGWLDRAFPAQAELMSAAILGLYKLGGVDLVREQIDAAFAPRRVNWDLRGRDLIVRPADAPEVEAAYELDDAELSPRFLTSRTDPAMPKIDGHKLLLAATPFAWDEWVQLWDPKSTIVATEADEPARTDVPPSPAGTGHPPRPRNRAAPAT